MILDTQRRKQETLVDPINNRALYLKPLVMIARNGENYNTLENEFCYLIKQKIRNNLGELDNLKGKCDQDEKKCNKQYLMPMAQSQFKLTNSQSFCLGIASLFIIFTSCNVQIRANSFQVVVNFLETSLVNF